MAIGAGTVGAIAIGAFATPAAATGLAAAVTLPSFTPAPSAGLPVRSHFAGHEGEVFLAVADAASVALTLTAVEDVTGSRGSADEHRFSLIFTTQGQSDAELDGIIELSHPTVPAATLFVSTVGLAGTPRVQALINRSA